MTDKQIIIDGVQFNKWGDFLIDYDLNGIYKTISSSDKCYKILKSLIEQLQAKEQECERLEEKYSKQLHKNIEKQGRINELQGIVSTKEFILKVNGKKYTNLSGIDKARFFINNEIRVRNKKIIELKNEMSSLQWLFYDKCKKVVEVQQQLDRLKKENEELKKKLKINEEYHDDVMENMLCSVSSNSQKTREILELQQQLDQLKKENEELKKENKNLKNAFKELDTYIEKAKDFLKKQKTNDFFVDEIRNLLQRM